MISLGTKIGDATVFTIARHMSTTTGSGATEAEAIADLIENHEAP